MAATNFWQAIAQIVDYPVPELRPALGLLAEACSATVPEASAELRKFCDELDRQGLAHFEELYTSAFDFETDGSPYIGYHLFGEDPRRSHFMAALKGRYAEQGINVGVELPDHLSAILRLLAVLPEGEEANELITDCLVPGVEKMQAAFEGKKTPYAGLLHAVSLVLEEQAKSASARSEGSCQPFFLSSSPTSR
jgi:nitrate reductase molybdenum cofactor assembly chaperone